MLLLYLFEDKIIGIGLWLITQLFRVAAVAFKVFMLLAQNDVLSEIDYSRLLTNFYVIIGIIMLFIMAFALLRGIINPDDQKQGTTAVKNIIINFVLSCVMLGFLPTVFPFMFDVQDAILRYNVIGGFFGYGDVGKVIYDNKNVSDVEAGAYRLVNGVFTGFFNVSSGFCNNALGEGYDQKVTGLVECQKKLETDAPLKADGDDHNGENNFYVFKQHVDETGDFGVYSAFIDAAADNNINFNFIVLLIAGCALIYVGISYCFDMALRLIKLIFYQVLAPIPIFLRIIPNSKFSGTFNQWLKVTLTCWMEVFVRIFIFSFCMWLCTAIMSTDFLTKNIYDYGSQTGLFAQAFILMAIVMFMKRSPKLLSEITGIDSGNMKLGIREKLAEGGGFVAGAAIGGGLTAGIRNLANSYEQDENGNWHKKDGARPFRSTIAGAASGFFRGGRAGLGAKNEKDMASAAGKGAANAVNAREERRKYVARHGGTVGAMIGHAQDALHNLGRWAGIDNITALLEQNQLMEQIKTDQKAIDAASRDTIIGDAQKGKNNDYGLNTKTLHRITDKAGNTLGFAEFSNQRYRRIMQDLEAAKNSGDEKKYRKLQDFHDNYLAAYADAVSNQALLGETNWDKLTKDQKVSLTSVKQAADKHRSNVAQNINASFMEGLVDITDVLDKNKDLTVKHSSMKDIKDNIDLKITKNKQKINEVRQRESDSKKGSGS